MKGLKAEYTQLLSQKKKERKKKDYTQRWKSRAVQWKKVKAVQHTNKKQNGDWQDQNPLEEEENNKKKKKKKTRRRRRRR